MDHFHYRDGRLHAEDVPLADIAAAVGTPCYVYSTATLERHARVFLDAVAGLDAIVCYAVKANPNVAVIETLGRLGLGADVVSGGELQAALAAGIPASRIVFSGVGKRRDEIAAALAAGVLQINVESEPELDLIASVAGEMGVVAPVAIRVNPDVDAGTHEKITTGRSENKFGIEWTQAHATVARARTMRAVLFVGIAAHIGSQLADLAPFRDAFLRLHHLVTLLRADGHPVETLDLGGGLGIPHGDEAAPIPLPEDYAAVVRQCVADLGCRLIFEPGRMLVGNAGVLLTRVLFVKEGATRTFVVVDAAMNDLARPSLYGAYHAVVPVAEPRPDAVMRPMDVVGPVCESGDLFGRDRPLPELAAGDLLVLRTAGAYGAVMASSYNLRPLVPEVLVRGAEFAVVRERLGVDALLALCRRPPWQIPRRETGLEARPEAGPEAAAAACGGGVA